MSCHNNNNNAFYLKSLFERVQHKNIRICKIKQEKKIKYKT